MSYAETLLENVIELARKNNAKEIKKIRLAVGELLLINPEQLEFCFKTISKNTIAQDAKLEIETAKAEIRCIKCGREYDFPYGVCECGGYVTIKGGKEMILKSVVMEVENAQD